MSRREDEAFAWVEHKLGGKGGGRRAAVEVAAPYFLDVEDGAGTVHHVVLRGFRNPGNTTPDEAGARAMLASEAAALRALQSIPVSAPAFLGYHEELGWLLMERVEGDSALTAIDDPDRRFAIYTGYVEELAKLHAYPLADIDLDPMLPRPESARA